VRIASNRNVNIYIGILIGPNKEHEDSLT